MDQLGFIYKALDLKILILFLLRRLPVDIETDRLLSLAQTDGAVSYFDFAICLQELQESGQVTVEDGFCRITESGSRNAAAVEDSLPYSVRQHAEQAADREIERINRGKNIRTGHTVTDGVCQVELSLADGVGEILSMRLLCSDERQARAVERNFYRGAEEIYQKIMEKLSN